MPKGEFSPCSRADRVSATPSPSASRSSTIRLGLGVPEPAVFMIRPMKKPRIPSDRFFAGPSVSATSTSPFGRTSNQRGCCRPVAKAATASPGAGVGVRPGAQPSAGATLTRGISCL